MDANLPNEGDLKGSKLSVNSFKGHSYTYIPSTLSDPISQNPRERTAKEIKELDITEDIGQFVSVMLEGRRREWL